jgi:hypothetical protein
VLARREQLAPVAAAQRSPLGVLVRWCVLVCAVNLRAVPWARLFLSWLQIKHAAVSEMCYRDTAAFEGGVLLMGTRFVNKWTAHV